MTKLRILAALTVGVVTPTLTDIDSLELFHTTELRRS
jgi:hypothetical protein